jgi:hypothetical protein
VTVRGRQIDGIKQSRQALVNVRQSVDAANREPRRRAPSDFFPCSPEPKSVRPGPRRTIEGGSALQAADALAVVAAAFLDPFHAIIGIRRLVGAELIRASQRPRLVRIFSRVFWRNRRRKHRVRGDWSALLLAKLLPLAALQFAGKLGGQIFQAASRGSWPSSRDGRCRGGIGRRDGWRRWVMRRLRIRGGGRCGYCGLCSLGEQADSWPRWLRYISIGRMAGNHRHMIIQRCRSRLGKYDKPDGGRHFPANSSHTLPREISDPHPAMVLPFVQAALPRSRPGKLSPGLPQNQKDVSPLASCRTRSNIRRPSQPISDRH